MGKKPHLLITGIRRPGSSKFRFRIYGHPGNQFPPVVMESTLGGLRRWIGQVEEPMDELGHRRAGITVLPLSS